MVQNRDSHSARRGQEGLKQDDTCAGNMRSQVSARTVWPGRDQEHPYAHGSGAGVGKQQNITRHSQSQRRAALSGPALLPRPASGCAMSVSPTARQIEIWT